MTSKPSDDEQRRQHSLDSYRILDTSPEQVFDELIGLIAGVCDVPMAILSFIDHDRQWLKASVGLGVSETPRDIAFCDHVVRSGKMMTVADAARDHRFANNPLVLEEPNIRFYAGVPLVAEDGSAIGSLAVLDRRERRLEPFQEHALKSFARLAMHELDLRRFRLDLEATLTQRDELVTALHRRDQQLAKAHEWHRHAAEASQAALWDYDMVKDRFEFSEAFRGMLGYERLEDMPTRLEHYMKLIHPDDRARVKLRARELVAGKGGDRASAEFRLRTASGSYRWLQSSSKVIRDADGNAIRRLGSTIDIHGRKLAEEKSREMGERLTSTLESITDAFFTLDQNWRFSYLNSQAERLMEHSRDELLGQVLWDIWPEARESIFHDRYREAIETGKRVDFEHQVEEDGQWIGFTVFPTDEGLAVYFRDVTERHQARQQAEESTERMRGVLESASDGIITIDQKARIESVNPAASRIFGYGPEEMLGQNIAMLIPSSLASQHDSFLKRYLDTGKSRIIGKPCRLTALRKDGSEFPIILSVSEVALSGRRVFTGFVRDITEQQALEEQLGQAQRLESIGQLTGGVAHDFNNLLTVILGNAELLAEYLEDNPRLHHLAEMTQAAARRGAELTARLLAFARRQRLEPRSVDIVELIADMQPLLRRSISEDIELKLVHPSDLWRAEIDPGQLESALLNLTLNAGDAMAGGGRLLLETSNAELDQDYVDNHVDVAVGEYVQITVSDNGHGIKQEHLSRVFEPFFTTKEYGKGTGLGLPMVYGFVKQSRGHIKIYSEWGVGSTVRIYLPRALGESDQPSPAQDDDRLLEGTERILVVEDDTLVRDHVERALVGLGYDVVCAAGGQEALALIDQHPPFDLLFSDVIMPGGLKGTELARRVKEVQPDIGILLTSGYTQNALIEDSASAASTLLLQKPYRRVDLARRVREALDQRNAKPSD